MFLSLRKIIKVYSSQTDNFGEAKSQQIEKMLFRVAVLQLILYITIKGGDVGTATRNSVVVD